MLKLSNVTNLINRLLEQIGKLDDNSISNGTANAITNTAGKVFTGVKLQMEYCKMKGKEPVITFMEVPKK